MPAATSLRRARLARKRGRAGADARARGLISYATQPGNVARDGADGNSPYTKALAEAIRTPGRDLFQTFNAVGLAVEQATAGSQQPWVSSSPSAGNFYFAGTAPRAAAPAVAPSPQAAAPTATDEAARAWSVIQNTTSIAVMEDFIRQFGTTVYGSMARARLAQMKKSQAVAVTPKPTPTPAPTQAECSLLVSGRYDVTASGFASDVTITVNGSSFSGSSKWTCCPGPRTDPIVNGVIQNGKISFTRICNGQGQQGECAQSYTGTITANGASGQWAGTGGSGSWTLHKH